MEDALTAGANHAESVAPRIRLGTSSFGDQQRSDFGQKIRLAMACIEGKDNPDRTRAMPSDTATINKRLVALSQDITSHHADLLELLVRFDELEGWKVAGAKHCMAWMNLELGINMKLGYEYLRVGRELRSLPTTTALFRAGKLSWSKVRLISRMADKANERILCHAALDASVTDVERLCTEFRWQEESGDNIDSDNDRYLQQWESRALSHTRTSNGSTLIRLRLPPELAQAYLNSIEHSLAQLEASESTISQRRADAAVLMAESSLQHAGRDVATADRYQVIVSVDAASLGKDSVQEASTCPENKQANTKEKYQQYTQENVQKNTHKIPSKRPIIKSAGPIARETARRIACDCTVTTNIVSNGEPTDIGRRSRVWPAAMSRAIKNRDQHCQWPGCNQSHNLQVHHIKHWADGGTTSVDNGCSLCQTHHTAVHEGGFVIQRVENHELRLEEQFITQRHDNDTAQFEFERNIRGDRNSFDVVRQLSPTRFRFRIANDLGQDIRCTGIRPTEIADGTSTESTQCLIPSEPDYIGHINRPAYATLAKKQGLATHANKKVRSQRSPKISTCVDFTPFFTDEELARNRASAASLKEPINALDQSTYIDSAQTLSVDTTTPIASSAIQQQGQYCNADTSMPKPQLSTCVDLSIQPQLEAPSDLPLEAHVEPCVQPQVELHAELHTESTMEPEVSLIANNYLESYESPETDRRFTPLKCEEPVSLYHYRPVVGCSHLFGPTSMTPFQICRNF